MKLCRRKSDGSVWEPSCRDDYTAGDALADAFAGRRTFYFRRVEWRAAPCWKFWTRGSWEQTGEVWEPESGEFEVVWHDGSEEATP